MMKPQIENSGISGDILAAEAPPHNVIGLVDEKEEAAEYVEAAVGLALFGMNLLGGSQQQRVVVGA